MKYFILGSVILLGILFFVYNSIPNCKTDSVTELGISGHTNLALHIHSGIEIYVDGKKQIIPPNIGIAENIMRPIHTHDASGEIHIEGLCARDYRLEEFFEVWNKQFSDKCVFDNCNGKVEMSVNGQLNSELEKYLMKDHDRIVINYTSYN